MGLSRKTLKIYENTMIVFMITLICMGREKTDKNSGLNFTVFEIK